MLIPVILPNMKLIIIFWDTSNEWEIEIVSATTMRHSERIRDDTRVLLSHSFGHRLQIKQLRHVALFKATDIENSSMLERNMSSPLQDCMGHPVGLLKDVQNGRYPYLFQDWLLTKPLQQYVQKSHKEYETFARDEPFVALKRWLTRFDFHHPLQGSATNTQ